MKITEREKLLMHRALDWADLFRRRISSHYALYSQLCFKNGSLDILAKRNSKLGGSLPYQSFCAARQFYLHPDFPSTRSATWTFLGGFLHSGTSVVTKNVCKQ
jgi:hypothetical protein